MSLKGTAQGPPDLLDHLLLPPGLLLGLLHLGHILRSPRGQKGTLMRPRPVPTAPERPYLPEDDTGVTSAGEGAIVQPAAVQPPDLVLMGI